MKVLTSCKIWFSNDIDAGELYDAVSGPLYGDYATFTDIECSVQHGSVRTIELTGYYDHPNRIGEDEDELINDIWSLVGDGLLQYGFPVEDVEVDIKDYCDA